MIKTKTEIKVDERGWEVWLGHKDDGSGFDVKLCLASESRARGGSKLLAIEKALQNLQSAMTELERVRSEEREH